MLRTLPSSHSPDANPLPPPSATLAYTQHPLMSPGCHKTLNLDPNPILNLNPKFLTLTLILLTANQLQFLTLTLTLKIVLALTLLETPHGV